MVPPPQLYTPWLNEMRKRFVIQLLFVSKFMTVWSEVALCKPNLQAYSHFTLTAQKMHRRLFDRGGTVTSSARCLGGLCSPGDTAHLATKRLSSSTSPLLQETSPRDILRANIQGERQRKERRHYLDTRIRRKQEQQRRGSLVEKQVLELSNSQTPILPLCSDIWIKYL